MNCSFTCILSSTFYFIFIKFFMLNLNNFNHNFRFCSSHQWDLMMTSQQLLSIATALIWFFSKKMKSWKWLQIIVQMIWKCLENENQIDKQYKKQLSRKNISRLSLKWTSTWSNIMQDMILSSSTQNLFLWRECSKINI